MCSSDYGDFTWTSSGLSFGYRPDWVLKKESTVGLFEYPEGDDLSLGPDRNALPQKEDRELVHVGVARLQHPLPILRQLFPCFEYYEVTKNPRKRSVKRREEFWIRLMFACAERCK